LYYFLGNYEDAQDAIQEAFLKCWRSLDSVPELKNVRAWVFRVGLNAAKDLQRNAWRRRARPLVGPASLAESTAMPPAQIAENRERERRLHDAILDLRPAEKEVFLLRQNGCLTFEEIAEMRRCPVGTVKTQMRAALAKLRQVFQDESSD